MPGDLPQPPPLIDLLEFRGALPNMAIAKLTTGIPGFDILTHGGIPEGRTTLVVGRSGTGKTVFSLQLAAHFARHGIPTLVLAVEETGEDPMPATRMPSCSR
jgi:KaiC/GvpD/RAD55 family RecA-like ATPase